MADTAFDPRSYWEQRLGGHFNRSGVGYLKKSPEINRWMYRTRRSALAELVENLGIDPQRCQVLDIGSGTGEIVSFWKGGGTKQLTGLDFTQVSVDALKVKYPEFRFEQADAGEPGMKLGDQYDVVTIFDVLFHIVDDDRFENAAKNIAAHLKPNAIVIITDVLGPVRVADMVHCNNRSRSHYREVFDRVGLTTEEIRPLFYTGLPPAGIASKGWRKFWTYVWEGITLIGSVPILSTVCGGAMYGIDKLLRSMKMPTVSGKMLVLRKR